jgi:flagellar assembly protein FliH
VSSRLYRASEPVDAQPLAWRTTNGLAPILRTRQAGAPHVYPAPTPGEVEARILEARQQGYAKGQAEGAEEGEQRALERLAPLLASFKGVVQELVNMRPSVRQEAEAGTVELAIAIARRVLHREFSVDPGAILGLVKAAGDRLNRREAHTLRVAPADAALIQENRARLNLPESLKVLADSSLAAGSAVFETSRGEMDASANTQLDEIQRGLADVIRRRAK